VCDPKKVNYSFQSLFTLSCFGPLEVNVVCTNLMLSECDCVCLGGWKSHREQVDGHSRIFYTKPGTNRLRPTTKDWLVGSAFMHQMLLTDQQERCETLLVHFTK